MRLLRTLSLITWKGQLLVQQDSSSEKNCVGMTLSHKSGKKATKQTRWRKKVVWKMISLAHRKTNLKPTLLMMVVEKRSSRKKLEFSKKVRLMRVKKKSFVGSQQKKNKSNQVVMTNLILMSF